MRKHIVGCIAVLALVASGCGHGTGTSPATTTTGTPADTLACHDFGTEAIQHGATTSSQQIEQLLSEILSATNPGLRRAGGALRTAISNHDTAGVKKATLDIGDICLNLGLINRDGAPT